METIIIFGSGGREFSIIKSLYYDSRKIDKKEIKIVCVKTNVNTYIYNYCDILLENNKDLQNNLDNIVKKNNVILSIIGSEQFLFDGYGDYFLSKKIPCVGPTKNDAKLETSKTFCRDLLLKILPDNIPHFKSYDTSKEFLLDYVNYKKKDNKFYDSEIVIKKDGLFRGKGVYVENDDFKGNIESDFFDDYKDKLVIEEKLYGEEYSLMSLVDKNGNIIHFPPIRDYKRLEDNDKGPNTGGMGCVIDSNNTLPFLNGDDILKSQEINKIVINNTPGYTGVLYGSFMKTKNGIKIIEFNCRFGDPECILLMKLIQNSLYDIFKCFSLGKLNKVDMKYNSNSAICVYVNPKNYCRNTIKKIKNNKYDLYLDNKKLYDYITYSNIEVDSDHIYSLNSRCLAITETNPNLYNCYNSVYNKLKSINGNISYRKDIGSNFLSTYEKCGVSIENANKSLSEIKNYILSTYNDNVISEFGSFGGEYKLGDNVLVCSIDGVGTKTNFVKNILGNHGFINLGKDIVSHSINDILVQGAKPLFFLDYFGTNILDKTQLNFFIKGISQECKKYGNIPILGGETAEMPIVYKEEATDLIGCIIGIKDNRFFKNNIKSGDIIINLPSSGPHTNGYTLINKLYFEGDNPIITNKENMTSKIDIINKLISSHKCYIEEVYEFINNFGYDNLHGMCHITGGGLYENLKRVVGHNKYEINVDLNKFPDWCRYLMNIGDITKEEMLNVFNCGFGFILIVDESISKQLNTLKFDYEVVGYVV